jgi:type II secretory pathway pseudopilin PulG
MVYVPKKLNLTNLIVAIVIVWVLLALLLPAVSSAREAARRSQCQNNLKQIILALLNYESAYGRFPPAYVADASGKPVQSWRVLILPFLDERVLFQRYNANEPWNGPNNSKLAAEMPEVYRCPGQEVGTTTKSFETHYFAIVAPETGWPGIAGRNIRQFSDGTAKTIMVIEATGLGVHWMEPRDVTLAEAVELLTTKPRSGHRHVEDGFLTTTYYETSFRNVSFCDGRVVWMGQFKDADLAIALLTAAGRETIAWRDGSLPLEAYQEAKTTAVIKWGKVWGLSVFVVLSLLPAAWLRTRKLEAAAVEGLSMQQIPGEA